MDTFIVFTYQFSPITVEEPSLFEEEIDPRDSMDHKNLIFQDILDDDNLLITYRNSRFRRRVLLSKDRIVVFQLANNRLLRVEKDFQSNSIENYPSIKIIVDNRDEKQRILIEHRTGAFYDEYYVARILQNSFRSRLRSHRLNIAINKEFQSSEFWDIVLSAPKGVEKIRFSFPYPNLSRIRDAVKELVSEVNTQTNSKDTKIELNSAPGEVLSVDRENGTWKGLVDAASGTGQQIMVKAKGVKYHQIIGETKKLVYIEEIEGTLPEMAFEKLVDKLNEIQ